MKLRKKIKNEIVAGILAFTMLISPVINLFIHNKSKKTSSDNPSPSVSVTIPNNVEDTPKSDKDFILEVNNIESVYNFDYSELTIPDYSITTNICSYQNDLELDNVEGLYEKVSILFKKIKENSASYLNEHPEFVSAFLTDTKSKYHEDQIAVQTILNEVIGNIFRNYSNKDLCLIKDLKVVISYDNDLDFEGKFVHYSSEDKVFIVFPNNIRNTIDDIGFNFWNALRAALQHELNIMRQQSCNCQKDNITFPYKTIREAALVSELYNLGKTDELADKSKVRSENLILLLGLFHDNSSIYDYYNSVFNNDILSFYKFCGVNNDDDIYKLNKILYTMDIIYGDNAYTEESVGYDYRVDIFSMVINNMIVYTSQHKDFKLKDNLILFNVIKNLIVNDMVVDVCNDEFNNIIKLNDLYIDFLSIYYNVSRKSIEVMENGYDVTSGSLALLDICHEYEDFSGVDVNELAYSSKILKKFPLLKQILAYSIFSPLDYQKFIDSNTAVYDRKNAPLIRNKQRPYTYSFIKYN